MTRPAMNTICPTCDQRVVPRCDRCGCPYREPGEPFMLPPPFGSLNAAAPVTVCRLCYQAYARLGWAWLGRPEPPDDIFGWDKPTTKPVTP